MLVKLLISAVVVAASLPASANEFDALFKARKFAEVEKLATRKLAAEPNNADALNAKIQLAMMDGKDSALDDGAKLAEQCIAANPQSSECHESLGNVLGAKAQRGSMFSAMSYAGKIRDAFKRAVELDANNFGGRVGLLQYYLMAPGMVGGGKDKAQAFVAETARFNARAGVLLQASVDLGEKNYDKAASAVLGADPRDAEDMSRHRRNVLTNVGHAYVGEKKFAEADKLFRVVMADYADASQGYFGMGKSLQEQGKPAEALPLLEKSLALNPYAGVHYRIGKCWQALGDKAKAIAAYEKALAFQPELPKQARRDAEDQLKTLRKT